MEGESGPGNWVNTALISTIKRTYAKHCLSLGPVLSDLLGVSVPQIECFLTVEIAHFVPHPTQTTTYLNYTWKVLRSNLSLLSFSPAPFLPYLVLPNLPRPDISH